ncbi:hypothetical protein HDU93_003122 [Gonapodya sp. JEL0774]|nr:hypothetical protein HDU93_003122 [Gonapodya sp. JEL0774]
MPVPQSFKAATIPTPGAQHVIADRTLPALQSGEVAIRITATAINPVDWKMRDYKFFISEYPAVVGSDAAGEVAAVGPDVVGFAEGDRVFFQGIIGNYDSSTFQQYCKMPASLVSKTPKNITDEQAAGISLATVAVVTGFYDKTGSGLPAPWDKDGDKVGAGKALVVIGGSSSLGQYAIQFARLSGFTKIVTNAGAKHADFLKSLGATDVLDRTTASTEAFKTAIGSVPLAFVYDSISDKSTQKLSVSILRALATAPSHVVTVLRADEEAVKQGQEQEPKVTLRHITGRGNSPALRYLTEPMVKYLGGEDGVVAKGLYIPNRPIVVPGGLPAIEVALEKNKKGVSGEKVVLRPQE